jgi:hypothetical protein
MFCPDETLIFLSEQFELLHYALLYMRRNGQSNVAPWFRRGGKSADSFQVRHIGMAAFRIGAHINDFAHRP